MKSYSFVWTVLIVAYGLLTACAATTANVAAGTSATELQVATILGQVQRALITVQDSADAAGLPKLDSVTLSLETQLAKASGGKLELYVVSFGANVSKAETQTLTLKLVPPKPGTPAPVSKADFSQNLAEAILSVARGVQRARTEKPQLGLAELTASIKFVVAIEGGGGAKISILPVSLDLSGKLTEASTHSVKVVFK